MVCDEYRHRRTPESELFVDMVTWLIVGLVGLALLVYLLAALIHPEKW